MVTNSESLAKAIEKANCGTSEDIDSAVSKEARKQSWDTIQSWFEQRVEEEDEVRANWLGGKFKEEKVAC